MGVCVCGSWVGRWLCGCHVGSVGIGSVGRHRTAAAARRVV